MDWWGRLSLQHLTSGGLVHSKKGPVICFKHLIEMERNKEVILGLVEGNEVSLLRGLEQ